MTDDVTDALLDDWSDEVRRLLGIDELAVDRDAVLGLAGDAAHAVVRPAAPLTTFLVGFAAGRAASDGAEPESAVADAISAVAALARSRGEPRPRGAH